MKSFSLQTDITETSSEKLSSQTGMSADSLYLMLKKEEFISLYDSTCFSVRKHSPLFQTFNTMIENADNLAAVKDDRLILDGMWGYITITKPEKNYKLIYRAPCAKSNLKMHLFIKQVLLELQTKSKNNKVKKYCNEVLSSYMRDDGGAYIKL